MKNFIFIFLISTFLIISCTDKFDVDTCKIDSVIADDTQINQMLFTRLMAIAVNNNSYLHEKIKELSHQKNNLYYEEILVGNLLKLKIEDQTANDYLKGIVMEKGDELEIDDYDSFISTLMNDLPLLVVKIPDWLINTNWDTEETKPWVFSNMYGINHQMYGFKSDGACYTKPKYYESKHFELLVKNSEDYFLLKDKSLLEYLQHPCMSIDDFIENYCRKLDNDILVKKRALQKLFGLCAPEYVANSKTPDTNCPRDEANNSNYVIGFRLASPTIIYTMHNDNCIAGEETYDFQVDFHYGIRTGEDDLDMSHHLMIPLFGIRYAELINPDGTTRTCDIFSDFPEKVLNFTYFINKDAKEWDRDKYGDNIILLWNEVDFLNCGNNKYFDETPIEYSYGFPLGFSGKDQNPQSKFDTSKFNNFKKTGVVFGQDPIPLGWNNYPYCAEIKTVNPTGAQALEVFFEISLHD